MPRSCITLMVVALAGWPSNKNPALETETDTERRAQASTSSAPAIGERQMFAVHTTKMRSGIGSTVDTRSRLTAALQAQLPRTLTTERKVRNKILQSPRKVTLRT